MLHTLRSAFGDPSRVALVAAAKQSLMDPNVPLQEGASALERLSAETDPEYKTLVLAYATNSGVHEWLQQVAGEAVAQMLEHRTIAVEDVPCLTSVASEVAAAILEGSEEEQLRLLAVELRAAHRVSVHAAANSEDGEA